MGTTETLERTTHESIPGSIPGSRTGSLPPGVGREPDDEAAETRLGRARPAGIVAGGFTFVAAWLVGLAIARLTGAAAVVLLLVVGAVALLASVVSGWVRVRSLRELHIEVPSAVTVGEAFDCRIRCIDTGASRTPLVLTIGHARSDRSARTQLQATSTTVEVRIAFTVDRPGTVTQLHGSVGSNGTGGLLWWRRRITVRVGPIAVAPTPAGPPLAVDQQPSTTDGSVSPGRGRPIGDVDGIRPWRQGESDQAIHWPSTIRSGSIVAHARDASVERRWNVALDQDPGRLRWTLDDGIRHGHEVYIELPDGETAPVRSLADSARWSTVAADRQHGDSPVERARWWSRSISLSSGVHEPATIEPLARWIAALAAAIALNMLLGALGDTALTRVVSTVGLLVGAAVSVRFRNDTAPTWLRVTIIALTFAALGRITMQASGIGGLIDALRGPMPDLLMLLLVLHGAESVNRRTVRVHVAITATIVAYAAGLRIDDRVGWWMLAWGVAAIAALALLSVDATGRATAAQLWRRRWARSAGAVTLCIVASFGLASLVPIPDGPASLGLPAVSNNDAVIAETGALVGPDGNTSTSTTPSDGSRGALGEVGGYPGFSETLDTSVRGDLGDEIVMRVRAPEPAFWRGQTFTEFDGRIWRVSSASGPTISGPQIDVEPTIGDLPARGVDVEEFVQTFHVEADLPNVIFAAARAETIVFDGSVTTRPDGALRADRTLTDGTIYTVVSQRAQVTPELLRSQGDIAQRFDEVTDARADTLLAPYLELPESTTARTIELAERLSVDGSTYDTILAYEDWLATNTEYDLDAPVPAEGTDAVDDYLFESRRGFCEQIASALVVMLRSQGVPARLATGYIPGERDQVSGVWKVRASDAHAWVEVWFPDTGWEAFDPTAFVPLAGDVDSSTVGNDVASAVIGGITARPVETGLGAAFGLGVLGSIRGLTELRRRRRRGAWGLLHDRFAALAPDELTVQRVADTLAANGGDTDPHTVAAMLDRVAFDPDFGPSSSDRQRTASAIRSLERNRPRPRRAGR